MLWPCPLWGSGTQSPWSGLQALLRQSMGKAPEAKRFLTPARTHAGTIAPSLVFGAYKIDCAVTVADMLDSSRPRQ